MITVYKYVVYSKNITFLKYILFAHRNGYCIQMLLSGKTEVASPEKLSGHNRPRFRTLEYDRIPAPDSIYYSELHRYVVLYGIKLYLCLLQMVTPLLLSRQQGEELDQNTYGVRNRRQNVCASLEVCIFWLGCLISTTTVVGTY